MVINYLSALKENSEKFKFTAEGDITFYDILEKISSIDRKYPTETISSQIRNIQLLPHTLIFLTKECVSLKAFLKLYEELVDMMSFRARISPSPTKYPFDKSNSRIFYHSRFLVMDLFVDEAQRRKYSLYSLSRDQFTLKESPSYCHLKPNEEVEVIFSKNYEKGFKFSKTL